MTCNYGRATEYNEDYAAGRMGGKTDLTTANFNLSGAYSLDSNCSFRLGFDAHYAKAKNDRYAGDLAHIVAASGARQPALTGPVSMLPAATQIAHLHGHA
ncbi:long-chain fatty acid transporter, partial [Klebsiella pneumoniae]